MECWKSGGTVDILGSLPGGQGSLPRMLNIACVINAAKQQLLRMDAYLQESQRRTGSKRVPWPALTLLKRSTRSLYGKQRCAFLFFG